jgi:hypothetical protein
MDISTTANKNSKTRYLISRNIDFLCLGGAGIIIIPLILLFLPYGDLEYGKSLILIAWYISFFINYPHFMYSYQLFFESFREIKKQKEIKYAYLLRFYLVLYLVPTVIIIFAICGFIFNQKIFFTIMYQAMFFFVGWHYVKQGFGVLMTNSARNKCYFSPKEKKAILSLCYLTWLTAWCLNNQNTLKSDDLLEYTTLQIPNNITEFFLILFVIFSFEFCRILIVRYKQKKLPPFTYLAAFIISLFFWIFAAETPIYWLFIPALHSLQYLVYVYSIKKNQLNNTSSILKKDFTKFALIGIISGALFFEFIPNILDIFYAENYSNISNFPFYLTFLVFINIHHYFIDNTIWHKENKTLLNHLK